MMVVEIYIIIAIVVVAVYALILSKRKKKSKKEGANVPQGLQVFDEKGNITLDLTDRLTRLLCYVTFDEDISSEETPWSKTYEVPKGSKVWWAYTNNNSEVNSYGSGWGFSLETAHAEYEFLDDTHVKLYVYSCKAGSSFYFGVC